MQHLIVNKNEDLYDIEKNVKDIFGIWLKKRITNGDLFFYLCFVRKLCLPGRPKPTRLLPTPSGL